jgi:hypothetical protein
MPIVIQEVSGFRHRYIPYRQHVRIRPLVEAVIITITKKFALASGIDTSKC